MTRTVHPATRVGNLVIFRGGWTRQLTRWERLGLRLGFRTTVPTYEGRAPLMFGGRRTP